MLFKVNIRCVKMEAQSTGLNVTFNLSYSYYYAAAPHLPSSAVKG
jgi:hypothetical protein